MDDAGAVTFDDFLKDLDEGDRDSVKCVADGIPDLESYGTWRDLKTALKEESKIKDGPANRIAQMIWKKLRRPTDPFDPASVTCWCMI